HHAARVRFEHGDGHDGAALGEHLRHAHLTGQDGARHNLISMLTPLVRLSRMRASTTLGFASRMSRMRLCVRISNCSRESLSMNGERMTVYLLMRVGAGTGRPTRVPS